MVKISRFAVILALAILSNSNAYAARYSVDCGVDDSFDKNGLSNHWKVDVTFSFDDKDLRSDATHDGEALYLVTSGVDFPKQHEVLSGQVEGDLTYRRDGNVIYAGRAHTALDQVGIVILRGELVIANLNVYADYPSVRTDLLQNRVPHKKENGYIFMQRLQYAESRGSLMMAVPGVDFHDIESVFNWGFYTSPVSLQSRCSFKANSTQL